VRLLAAAVCVSARARAPVAAPALGASSVGVAGGRGRGAVRFPVARGRGRLVWRGWCRCGMVRPASASRSGLEPAGPAGPEPEPEPEPGPGACGCRGAGVPPAGLVGAEPGPLGGLLRLDEHCMYLVLLRLSAAEIGRLRGLVCKQLRAAISEELAERAAGAQLRLAAGVQPRATDVGGRPWSLPVLPVEGPAMHFDVRPLHTVGSIKARFAERELASAKGLKVASAGRYLTHDGMTLRAAGVTEGCSVVVGRKKTKTKTKTKTEKQLQLELEAKHAEPASLKKEEQPVRVAAGGGGQGSGASQDVQTENAVRAQRARRVRERIDAGGAVGWLLEQNQHERPLCFDAAADSVWCGRPGCDDGFVTPLGDGQGRRTAMCSTQRMRGYGVHHASFDIEQCGAFCRVGVTRCSFDPRGSDSCGSDGPEGLAWSSKGSVMCNGQQVGNCHGRNWPANVEPYGSGDVLGLRLDLTQGTLTAYKNGRRLGVVAAGFACGAGGFCWSVDFAAPGLRLEVYREPPVCADAEAKAEEQYMEGMRSRIAAARAARDDRLAAEAELLELADIEAEGGGAAAEVAAGAAGGRLSPHERVHSPVAELSAAD
jgi:hypothetical protein